MASIGLVVGLSLASACAFAASSSLKHISAGTVPDAQDLHPHSLRAFVRATVTHRLWLAGIGCDAVGLALQLIALHLGSLTVVQPLLIAGLLFALVFRGLHDPREISARQLGWAVVVCVALGTFVALAAAGTDREPVDKLPAVVAAATGAVLAAGCIALGRRMTAGGGAAAVLGVAVGLVYAGTAALLKVVSAIIASDPLHLLVSWQFYLVIALGATGLMLNQLAFQAGPLAASLPATASIDPLASVAVGVAVFDERIRSLGGSAVSLVAILLLLGLAVVQLSRATPTTPSTESPG